MRLASWATASLVLALILITSSGTAATRVWDGQGGNGNWSTDANWVGDIEPVARDVLLFEGIINTTTFNDLPVNTPFNNISFGLGANPFIINGNSFELNNVITNSTGGIITNGGIDNLSLNLQTINSGIRLFAGTHNINSGLAGIALNPAGGLVRASAATIDFDNEGGGITTTTITNSTGGIIGGWARHGDGTATTWARVDAGNIVGLTTFTEKNAAPAASLTSDPAANIRFTSIAPVVLAGSSTTATSTTVTVTSTANLAPGMPITGTNIPANSEVVSVNSPTQITISQAATGTGTVSVTAQPFLGVSAGTTDINTLIYDSTTLGLLKIGAGNTLRFGTTGGIMRRQLNNNNLTIGAQGDGSMISAGGAISGTPGELIIDTGTGANPQDTLMIVNSNIVDNGVGGAVRLIKSGFASVIMRGTNTHTGGTFINEGRFEPEINVEALGPNVNASQVTIAGNGHLFMDVAGVGPNFNHSFFISGVGTTEAGGHGAIRLGGSRAIDGPVTLIGNSRITRRNGTGTINGPISGAFELELGGYDNDQPSTVVLTNATNSWTGGLKMSQASTVRIGVNSEVIPHGPGNGNVVMNVGSGARVVALELNGFNETINGLSREGSQVGVTRAVIRNNGATDSVLTLGDNNQSGTWTGLIQNTNGAGVGTLGITKIGSGTQILAGQHTYSGDTNVNGGFLSVGGTANSNVSINTASGDATFAGGGDGVTNGLFGNATVQADNGANSGRIAPGVTGPGSIAKMSFTNLTIENGGELDFDLSTIANSDQIIVTGTTSINSAGITNPLVISPRGGSGFESPVTVLTSSSPISYNGGPALVLNPPAPDPTRRPTSYSLDTVTNPNAILVNVVGGALPIIWKGNVDNVWDVNNKTNWSSVPTPANEKFFNDDRVTFDDTGANPVISIVGTVTPGGVTVNNATVDYTFGGPGTLTGSGGLTKQGAAKLTISGTLSHTGGTSVNGGTLEVVDGGSMGTSLITVEPTSFDPAILSLNATTSVSLDAPFAGLFGEVQKNGPGLAILTSTGSAGFFGPVNVNAGTLQFADDTSLGDPTGGAITVASGATLDLGAATSGANQVNMGARQIRINGTGVGGLGALINSNVNVQQQNAYQNVFLDSSATVGGPGRLDIRNGQNALTGVNQASLTLSGNTLTKSGAGQFSLVSVTVDSGNIVVNEGRFAVEAGSRILDDTVSTITINGSVAGTILSFFNLDVDLFGSDPDGALPSGGLVSRPIIFNGPDIVQMGNGSNGAGQISTIDSPITLNTSLLLTDPVAAQALFLRGPINNAGGHTITKGDGDVVLSGAGTHGVGALFDILSGGVVGLDSTTNNPLGATQPAFSIAAGGRLDFAAGTHNVNFVNTAAVGSTISVSAGIVNVNASTNNPLGGGADVNVTTGASLNITNGTAIARSIVGGAGSTTTVSDGATLKIGPGANRNSVLPAVNLNSTGTLDLTDGALIVDYTGASPYDALRQKLQSGINLAGGFWDGTGIISSSAAADGGPTAIGIIEASDLALLGITTYADPQSGSTVLDADAVVLKYTYWGDADTDGDNDVDDFIFWSSGFPSASGATWFTGDFDYDGDNDVDDFVFWSSTFPTLAPLLGGDGGGITAVPEPSSVVLIALGAVGLLAVARQRRGVIRQ